MKRWIVVAAIAVTILALVGSHVLAQRPPQYYGVDRWELTKGSYWAYPPTLSIDWTEPDGKVRLGEVPPLLTATFYFYMEDGTVEKHVRTGGHAYVHVRRASEAHWIDKDVTKVDLEILDPEGNATVVHNVYTENNRAHATVTLHVSARNWSDNTE